MTKDTLLSRAGLDETARLRRLAFLQWGPEDEANLEEVQAFARDHVDEIVETFYAHLWSFEETRKIFADSRQMARLKQLQRAYFLRMMEGRLDADYFESRLRVGDAHQQIDLAPQWYLGTFNLYLRLLIERLQDYFQDDAEHLVSIIGSLSKIIFLDMGLALDAYIMGGFIDRAMAQEYRRMADVAERTLQAKEEVERMKVELSNMIVHDLKGPLGGILTVTQLALRKRGAVSDAHARYFQQIERSARDLLRMIENLLEIDQMQEGRLEFRAEPVDVGLLMAECADEFRAAAEMVGLSIQVAIGDDVPIVGTDRWLLRRVLNNLVMNAIRHSGATGILELAASFQDGLVDLRVADRGRGMSIEEQATLFLKNASRGSRGQHRGDTGLGLVFCKMAVEVMRGTIRVETISGVGTTFIVTLPSAL